jgi:hypothetical protein
MRRPRPAPSIIAVALVLLLHAPAAADQILDEFDDLSAWSMSASPGVDVAIASDAGLTGAAMRVDYDFHGAAGYFIVRKAFALTLPENFAFRFALRGTGPPNNFEFKLIDPSGENVWWNKRRDYTFPAEWRQITVKRANLRFAWGAGGGSPREIAVVEFAVSAGSGGEGTFWVDDFRLEEREPFDRSAWFPKITASSAVPGHEPQLAADGDAGTSWRSAGASAQWVLLDL